MQKNRRPGRPKREPHKLCVKRLKVVRNITNPAPAQNLQTTARFVNTCGVRRSRRLSEKNVNSGGGGDDGGRSILLRDNYGYKKHEFVDWEDHVVHEIRLEIFRTAAVVDLIFMGDYHPSAMETDGQDEYNNDIEDTQDGLFQPIPAREWVFSTPEHQKIKTKKPKRTHQMVPAVLHTTKRNKTLYEMNEKSDFQFNPMNRQSFVDFEVGGMRSMATFPMPQGRFSPISEETTEGFFRQPEEMWRENPRRQQNVSSPTFRVRRQLVNIADSMEPAEQQFPALRHSIRHLDFNNDDMPCTSRSRCVPQSSVDNLFTFGVSPFQN